MGGGGLGRNSSTGVALTSSFSASGGGYEGSHGNIYRGGGSVYGDPTWQSAASSQLDDSNSLSYELDNVADVTNRTSEGSFGGYSIANRQPNRGNVTLPRHLVSSVSPFFPFILL